ncbi:hypothetical protein SAMN05216516_10524 [Izhakiella capsodis]|uniref:Uncharacterized protein n=1 Tax=Izhakiella capsodis TaxID=1367852 RepID=A0A1I4XV80_9GAMM|nr:hypothetical protein [Izhakiella capsodis]SFN29734.1 hypothetical protein SAMN05216516_10524 [Izhakiella capsodis]
MTYRNMQLNTSTWDLMLDGNGYLAVADGAYSVAQDVASSCLVFAGECFYDNTLGIPWKTDVMGKRPSAGFIAQKMQEEAKKLSVVDEALASIFFDKTTRTVRGTIRVTDKDGNVAQATF